MSIYVLILAIWLSLSVGFVAGAVWAGICKANESRSVYIRRAGPLGGDAQAADLRFDSGGRVPLKTKEGQR